MLWTLITTICTITFVSVPVSIAYRAGTPTRTLAVVAVSCVLIAAAHWWTWNIALFRFRILDRWLEPLSPRQREWALGALYMAVPVWTLLASSYLAELFNRIRQ